MVRRARIASIARGIGLLLAVAAGAGLGYLGLHQYRWHFAPNQRSWSDLAYYDLQLFVLDGTPLDNGGPYPLALQIARFLAPAATALAVLLMLRQLLDGRLAARRLRRSRRHAVVCGASGLARCLAERLAAGGTRVVLVHPDPGALPLDGLGKRIKVRVGDPATPSTLAAVGIAGARSLYACAEDSSTNLATVLAAAQVLEDAGRDGQLTAFAQVADTRLMAAMQVRRPDAWLTDRLRVDLFNLEQLAARRLLASEPIQTAESGQTRIVIAGSHPFAEAVLVEYARQWRLRAAPAGARLAVTLVESSGWLAERDLCQRYPFVEQVCDIEVSDGGLIRALRSTEVPAHRIFLCFVDETAGLSTALRTAALWRAGQDSVLVRMDRLAGLDLGFRFGQTRQSLLDGLDGRLRWVDPAGLAGDPDALGGDLTERLAMARHDRYLLAQRSKGVSPVSHPTMCPWEQLAEPLRQASRNRVRGIPEDLAMIQCVVAPLDRHSRPFRFTPEEIERLAVVEHDRWCDDLRAEGWTYGTQHDESGKIEPDLRPWHELDESVRRRARRAVTAMVAILAEDGLGVVRRDEADPGDPQVPADGAPLGTAAGRYVVAVGRRWSSVIAALGQRWPSVLSGLGALHERCRNRKLPRGAQVRCYATEQHDDQG